MNPILLATDGSRSAQEATKTAVELAKATARPLVVVTAWRVPVSAFGPGLEATLPEIAEHEEARAREALADAVNEAGSAGLDVRGVLREGDPVDEICAAASEAHAALIVIGAHGWGRLRRLVFGSVSNGVLHHAPCPVVVVREQGDAQPA